MKIEELQENVLVKNIKYGTVEHVLHLGIMKINDEWVDSVTYVGKCRNTNRRRVFTKRLEDFLKEFELYEKNIFD